MQEGLVKHSIKYVNVRTPFYLIFLLLISTLNLIHSKSDNKPHWLIITLSTFSILIALLVVNSLFEMKRERYLTIYEDTIKINTKLINAGDIEKIVVGKNLVEIYKLKEKSMIFNRMIRFRFRHSNGSTDIKEWAKNLQIKTVHILWWYLKVGIWHQKKTANRSQAFF